MCIMFRNYSLCFEARFQISTQALCNSCISTVDTVQTVCCRLRLKCDGTRAETRLLHSAKRTSPFKSAGASVQSTTGSRGARISVSNAGYTVFWGGVKSTGYALHSPVSPSLPLTYVTLCHHISTGHYQSLSTSYEGMLISP